MLVLLIVDDDDGVVELEGIDVVEVDAVGNATDVDSDIVLNGASSVDDDEEDDSEREIEKDGGIYKVAVTICFRTGVGIEVLDDLAVAARLRG